MSRSVSDSLLAGMHFAPMVMCSTCGQSIPEHMRESVSGLPEGVLKHPVTMAPDAMDRARAAPTIPNYKGGGAVCEECQQEIPHYLRQYGVGGPGSSTYKQMTAVKIVGR